LIRHLARIFSVAASRPRAGRRNYWIGAALGALALASPLVIAAAPAAALGIQFGSVSGDGSGDLTITVTSDYQLTDWTISLSGGTSTYTLDDFTDFHDQDTFAAGQPQTYVLPTADAQSVFGSAGIALPPGNYTATASAATATDGTNTETLASPQTMTGSFGFLAQPTLTLSGPTFNTTQPNQSVTIQGQITGCSTVACPSSWSGTSATVADVTATGNPQWTGTTTDATGDFSVPGVTGIPGDKYSVSIPATPTRLAAAPATTQDMPQYAQALIMATAANAPYGKQTIKGKLTYQSGLQQVGSSAGVKITATAGSHTLTTTTSSGGAFRLTVPPITGTTTWLLSTQNDLSSTPFLAGTQSSVAATQLWPTAVTRFTAKVTPNPQQGGALLDVSGCVVITISRPAPPSDPEVEIEWRGSRTAKWQGLGHLSTGREPGCAGLAFSGSGTPEVLSAYYRAVVIPDTTYATSASASTGRVWIHQTRFRPFTATPHVVASGQKVTIKGTLQYHAGKWRGLAHQRVAIIFSHNKKNWLFLQNVRTNRNGAFSLTFRDVYKSGWWSANYQGNKTDVAVSAGISRVRVRGHASTSPAAPTGLRPVSRLTAPGSSATRSGLSWPGLLPADPWLLLMGD